MKKIFATAGLTALGVASLHAANSSGLGTTEQSKFWSVSVGLRGFYDDNYAMRPNNVARDSFGFEVMPSVKLNYAGAQTYVGLSYEYTMKYYDDRVNNSADHSHVVNAR